MPLKLIPNSRAGGDAAGEGEESDEAGVAEGDPQASPRAPRQAAPRGSARARRSIVRPMHACATATPSTNGSPMPAKAGIVALDYRDRFAERECRRARRHLARAPRRASLLYPAANIAAARISFDETGLVTGADPPR